MKARISEFLDGELEPREAQGALDALRSEGEARDTWRSYHRIGDAMRDMRMLSPGFAGRVAARLAQEPTVLAPARRAASPQRQRWQLLSAAASLAAVALVGWVAFAPQQAGTEIARVAPAAPAQIPALAQVPPPAGAHDYLYAHQGQSPRNSLQGVAPYVRTVSGKAVAPKR